MEKNVRLINANEIDYSPIAYMGELANVSLKDLKSGLAKLMAAQPTVYDNKPKTDQLDSDLICRSKLIKNIQNLHLPTAGVTSRVVNCITNQPQVDLIRRSAEEISHFMKCPYSECEYREDKIKPCIECCIDWITRK